MAIELIRERIAASAHRAGRKPGDVTLIAVSKGASPAQLRAAFDSGHRDFGENRAEGLADHIEVVPKDVRWHFIGHLQGNKVRRVRPAVASLHSLDRPELAEYWLKGPGTPPPVFVQVNVAGEPQKHGVAVEDAPAVVDHALRLGLDVIGLSTIPPKPTVAENSRRWFAALRDLRDSIAADHPSVRRLSMGMSDDFEVAVEEGATELRVGRAIFTPDRRQG